MTCWEDLSEPRPRHRYDYLFGYGSFGHVAHCMYGRLSAAAEAKLQQDAGDVVLRRAAADVEAFADLRIGEPVGQEGKNLRLALGEWPPALEPGPAWGAERAEQLGCGVGVAQRAQALERP